MPSDPNVLSHIWPMFELPESLISAQEVEWWPRGDVEALVSAGLLVPTTPSDSVWCRACDDPHAEEVELERAANGALLYFIPCPEAVRVEVPGWALRRWQLDVPLLARRLKELMRIDVRSRAREKVPGRLWRLGNADWKSRPREVYLARGLAWSDGAVVANHIPCDARPIVMVGSSWPPPSIWSGSPPPIVPLHTVLTLDEAGMPEIDHALLVEIVAGADAVAAANGNIAAENLKRTIHQLTEQRLAQGGTADLIDGLGRAGYSSRATAEEMTKRGVPISHSAVARKRKKIVGNKPPPSSKSILRDAASQPRNTRGKPIKNAQPNPEE